MMTTVRAAMAALFVLGLPATALTADPPEPPEPSEPSGLVGLYERVQPAVVRVHTREGVGTGFLIGPTQIATAWHVADVRHDLRIETLDGQLIAVEVTRRDRKRDLAVLSLPAPLVVGGEAVAPLSLAAQTPPVGTTVAVLGHPLAPPEDVKKGPTKGLLTWSLTEGIVSQIGETSVQTSAAVQPGNSGGPILDLQGNVIGVVTLGIGSLGAATRVELLRELLDGEASLPKGPTVEPQGRFGLGVSRLPGRDARSGTFLTLTTGLEVVLDRKLMVGLVFEADLLARKKVDGQDDGRRGSRLLLAAQIGPRLELPFHPKSHLPFAIQPYFTAGIASERTGTHEQTLRFKDPGCDPFAQDCAYDATSGTTWDTRRWMPAVGGGVRADFGPYWFDVQATTNPADTKQDTRVMLGFGIRF